MFQSVIDHRQLQVVHDKFEFHLKLQIVNLRYYIAVRSLNYRETLCTTRLKLIKRAQTVEQRKTQPKELKHKKV